MGEPALKAADFVSRSPAMRADRSVRPKLLLDVIEGRLLVVKSRVGKDRFGHGLAPIAKPYRCTFGMSSETSPFWYSLPPHRQRLCIEIIKNLDRSREMNLSEFRRAQEAV